VGDPAAGELRALRTAEEYLERVGQRFQGRIGVGRVADSIDGLSSSRRDTERVLQVLRDRPGMPRAARLADVQLEVLLHELAALADADDYVFSGGLERLIAYDAKHKTALLPSLRSWLDGLDAIASAKDMHVHVNTFRYRLRRVAEIAEVDLEDPQTRFALMLELRLLDRVADARVAATEPPEA
jgi:DNA-binding PucR family transcriptional regulator